MPTEAPAITPAELTTAERFCDAIRELRVLRDEMGSEVHGSRELDAFWLGKCAESLDTAADAIMDAMICVQVHNGHGAAVAKWVIDHR